MSNGNISLIIAIIMTLLVIALLGLYFAKLRKKCLVKSKKRQVGAVLLSCFMVVITIANYACYAYQDLIDVAFSKSTADEEEVAKATAASKELVEQIEGEGAVLLENKNDVLPLNVSDPKEANINIFGWSSVDLIHGGGGSSSKNMGEVVDLVEGLENAGFHVNQELIEFYKSFDYERETSSVPGVFVYDFNIYEAPVESYSEELLSNARDFSDVALIVLTRQGGEDGELPMDMSEWGGREDQHYLELSDTEREMIDMIKAQGYEKVIAVINSSHAMELGFLEEEGIDGAIWIGGPGANGCNAIGKIMSGEINPSGRLADTYAYDLTSAPAYYNAGAFWYKNAPVIVKSMTPPSTDHDTYHSFVDYAEGIYVGYRYYETRWIDNETGVCDEESYQQSVQYPFGYGLSYTDFTQEITNFSADDTTISIDVTVTNQGDVPGKDVVQIYYTAPYTTGGIEKSHVVLGAFDKTEMLEPGESETVTLTMDTESMASYDYINEKCYVLDAGDYEIKLMNNSHDVIDSRIYTVDSRVVFDENNKRESDMTAAINQFDDMTYGDNVAYVSRADWEGTLPKERTADRDASDELIAAIENTGVEDDPSAEPIVVQDNGLKFSDMAGVPYDDPKWDQLLEQIPVDEMANLIGIGGYVTQEMPSIDKQQTVEVEGPLGMNSFMNGIAGVKYPSEVVLASTWNVDLAKEMGLRVGEECRVQGYDGIMAPAMNIHRTPFSGRNFEYYSEDSFLSGMMGANTVQGYKEKGVNTFLKHFALNDQETNRWGVSVWCNEQAAREIYFKPFELSVKEGGSQGIMSAFNRLGTTWAGANYSLLTTVLRDEWGFQGAVVSDMAVWDYMNTDQAIRAGNDYMLTLAKRMPSEVSIETNAGNQAMRKATHNVLYALANSNAMNNTIQQDSSLWLWLLGGCDVLVLIIGALGFYGISRNKKQKRQ
ncbi:beta-glucosidase [Mediterraneibacter catenae]|uniref:Beta-glucosidase n=1 Tax=Mediterraneibacter catenae TaxID=2594882 RepID=A0A5M9I0I1_9FIRM|nr:glycoside hydrolase family 3 N-terminal domain-containing protein [Mediterraneibacter catenae]KAA8501316.1 beta-glucosidase [Mediterraneibacter catenae]